MASWIPTCPSQSEAYFRRISLAFLRNYREILGELGEQASLEACAFREATKQVVFSAVEELRHGTMWHFCFKCNEWIFLRSKKCSLQGSTAYPSKGCQFSLEVQQFLWRYSVGSTIFKNWPLHVSTDWQRWWFLHDFEGCSSTWNC